MIDKKILVCPYCLKCGRCKLRRFGNLRNLHIHLKMKHHVAVKFEIPNEVKVVRRTYRKSRTKRP